MSNGSGSNNDDSKLKPLNEKPFLEPKTMKSALVVDPPLEVACPDGVMKQNFGVISFISPEDRIKQRFFYSANKFLYYSVNKQLADSTTQIVRDNNTKLNDKFTAQIEHYQSSTDPAYGLVAEALKKIHADFIVNEDKAVSTALRQYRINHDELIAQFDHYKDVNEKEISAEFGAKYDKGTSIRGFKVSGVYEDIHDAKARGAFCRNNIEQGVHKFVFPIGRWCPWDPSPDAIADSEYMVDQLNEMMHKYNDNVEQKNEFFQQHQRKLVEVGEQDREKAKREQLKASMKAQREEARRKERGGK